MKQKNESESAIQGFASLRTAAVSFPFRGRSNKRAKEHTCEDLGWAKNWGEVGSCGEASRDLTLATIFSSLSRDLRGMEAEYWEREQTTTTPGGSGSAFHLNGKIGFPGEKPNGAGLSTENFSKKREYLQRYSSFLVFTGITRKSPYHLLYRTSAMLLG